MPNIHALYLPQNIENWIPGDVSAFVWLQDSDKLACGFRKPSWERVIDNTIFAAISLTYNLIFEGKFRQVIKF